MSRHIIGFTTGIFGVLAAACACSHTSDHRMNVTDAPSGEGVVAAGIEAPPTEAAAPAVPTPVPTPVPTMDSVEHADPANDRNPHDRPGFVTRLDDGRLWIFRAGDPELAKFDHAGELAKHVIRPGAGPGGMTLKSPDADTILAYVAAKPGFVTEIEDGRVWVFREGDAELAKFRQHGELAKHVVRPAAGPLGTTLKAPDAETILAYVAAKPGFVTEIEDGRVWVFREGDAELAKFRQHGELAKHVVRPAAGPLGTTLKSPDAETILAYVAAKPGFVTEIEDGRVWVFRAGCAELAKFEKDGELAKHVVRPGAGPLGATLKAPDAETLDAYTRSSG